MPDRITITRSLTHDRRRKVWLGDVCIGEIETVRAHDFRATVRGKMMRVAFTRRAAAVRAMVEAWGESHTMEHSK